MSRHRPKNTEYSYSEQSSVAQSTTCVYVVKYRLQGCDYSSDSELVVSSPSAKTERTRKKFELCGF